jgi:hypothetical protein
MALGYYADGTPIPMFAGSPYTVAGGSITPTDRLQTSASGGSYIGGMAPQLPTQDMSFMWGGNGGAPPAGGGGWSQSMLNTPAFGGGAQPAPAEPALAPDDNHPNGVYPGPYNPNFGQSTGGLAGSPSLQSYTQNPYLAQMGQGLRDQFAQFRDDGLAANRGGAVATGGVGGSRQGIAEARTMTDAGKGFDSALANLYGNDYQQQMGRNLQKYQGDQSFALGNKQADNSYSLGQGNLALGNKSADYGFYTGNRQLDQGDFRNGLAAYGLADSGDWSGLNNANGIYNGYTGFGNTTNSSQSGGGALGGLGGALAGFGFAGQNGWWK